MLLLTLLFAFVQYINAQITFTFDPLTPDTPSQDFINNLIQNHLISSNGFVQFSNVRYTGHKCFALFNGGLSAAPTWPDQGIIMSSGLPEHIEGPNDSCCMSGVFGLPGDIDLDAITGVPTNDACVIEFDFSCPPETAVFSPIVNFDYVFASEEYPECVGGVNDVFAFFLNDQNIALVPNTTTPVSINTVNGVSNTDYFVLTTIDNTQADGYTTLMTATGIPVPDTNTIKLAIADSGDPFYDSWVLLQAGSFSCIEEPVSTPTCETEEDLGQTCVHDNADPYAYQHFNCCRHDSSLQDHGVRCTTCGACQGEGSLLDGKNGIQQTCCTANGPPSKKIDSTGTVIGDCVDGEYEHCCKIHLGGGAKDFVCFDDQGDNEAFCSGLAA